MTVEESTRVTVAEERWRAEVLEQLRRQTRYLQSFWLVLLIYLILNFVFAVLVLM